MEIKRFLADKIENNKVTLIGEEHTHLSQVLRMSVGQEVVIVCGDEYDYLCHIDSIDKKATHLTVVNKTKNIYNPSTHMTVFVDLIKNDNMNLVIQKLSELGVSDVVPFYSQYTVAKDKGTKCDKWQKIASQSTKQCGRSITLKVHDTISFDKMISDLKDFDVVYFANETEGNNTLDNVFDKNAKNIAVIIGCEGGFSKSEIEILKSHNAKSVTLGKRILRAETANIALCSVLMYKYGEWQ